jgi:hypothetical protein
MQMLCQIQNLLDIQYIAINKRQLIAANAIDFAVPPKDAPSNRLAGNIR